MHLSRVSNSCNSLERVGIFEKDKKLSNRISASFGMLEIDGTLKKTEDMDTYHENAFIKKIDEKNDVKTKVKTKNPQNCKSRKNSEKEISNFEVPRNLFKSVKINARPLR